MSKWPINLAWYWNCCNKCNKKSQVKWDKINHICSHIVHNCIGNLYTILLHHVSAEFSETPNPAYFYAYFCFCTRKISFRGFSFTLYCHRTSKLELQRRTADFRNFVCPSKSIPEMSKYCQKARPLLTSCMMFAPPTYWKFATCVDWALRTSHFPLAGVLLTSMSSVVAPFWWLRDHCVYLSRVLSWLIDVCIIKLSSAIPENIRWNYMKSLLFLNIHVLKSCVVWKHLNTSGSYRVKLNK